MRFLIVGASSAIATETARIWAEKGAGQYQHFVLLGRSNDKLVRVAADLTVRNPQATVEYASFDFLDAKAITAAVQKYAIDPIDYALIAQGTLPANEILEHDLAKAKDALQTNAVSPALFALAIVRQMLEVGYGHLGIIGSVAGDRGRQSNYVYGSAKGLLERLAEGLQNRVSGTKVRVTLIKPGPTDTPMAATHRAAGVPMASAKKVATDIAKAVVRGKSVLYTPNIWRLIMLVVRSIPAVIFNRLRL